MEKSLLLRKGLAGLVVLFMVFPFIHLLFYIPVSKPGWDPFLWPVLRGAFVQALISTLLTLSLGLFSAFGLIKLHSRAPSRTFRIFLFLIMIPSFLPPLVVVLLSTSILNFFPTGLKGIVFFHVLMNIGICSVVVYYFLDSQVNRWLREALVCGVSMSRFIFLGLMPELLQKMLHLGTYFFVLFFFSFSIPMLVGGGAYGGIEVFIYEKVILFGHWGEALHYSLGLFLGLLIFSMVLRDPPSQDFPRASSLNIFLARLGSWSPVPLVLLVPLLLGTSLLKSFLSLKFMLWDHHFWVALQGSLALGLLTGLVTFLVLAALCFTYFYGFFSKWMLALINPGWVVVGFSLLLLGSTGALLSLFKMAWGLSLLSTPFFYRLLLHKKFLELRSQVQVAKTCGVPWIPIFSQIIWPQCLASLCFLSGIAGVWAVGDFALSSIVNGSGSLATLALDMKTLIMSYRMEQALGSLLPLLLVSAVVFFTYQGLYYVSRKKILS